MLLPIKGKGTGELLKESTLQVAQMPTSEFARANGKWKYRATCSKPISWWQQQSINPCMEFIYVWGPIQLHRPHPHEVSPAGSPAPSQSGASQKFNRTKERVGQVLAGMALNLSSRILGSSPMTDMPFQWCPSRLFLVTILTTWVVYKCYFEILWERSQRFEVHLYNLKEFQQCNCQWKKRKDC